MPIVNWSLKSFHPSWRNIALLVVGLLSFLMSVEPVSAADEPLTPGATKIRDLLTSSPAWSLATTVSMPLPPLESWNFYPSTFSAVGAKLRLQYVSPDAGTVESDVALGDAGFMFTSAINGDISMVFDPADTERPFKGQQNGWTYWLVQKR
ncbi:hypothetical protein ACSFA8_09285 [Variovorax sp. RT4R15]|uniref:hypothetical protein n=1 Tax=Variovorax sp. RT4R15 TaxID=3443737 RepID=UPI003F472932